MHLRLGSALVAVLAFVAVPVGAASPAGAGPPGPDCLGRHATVVGTPGNDILRGTSHGDVMVGLGGKDTILGGGGNDLICGGAGRDRIHGGDGADQVSGGSGNDRLASSQKALGQDRFWADAGDDTYVVKGDDTTLLDPAIIVDFSRSPRGVGVNLLHGTARGWGHDTLRFAGGGDIVGSDHADVLVGTPFTDVLEGGTGADTIKARGGDDAVSSAKGHARLSAGEGNDVLFVGGAARVVHAGPGEDRIVDVPLNHQPEATDLEGGPGDDIFDVKLPHNGRIYVNGGDGDDDRLFLKVFPRTPDVPWSFIGVNLTAGTGMADDRAFGAATLESILIHQPRGVDSAQRYELTGTDGPNLLTIDHTSADSVLYGLGGDDVLGTGSGDDTLDGGDGNDYGAARGGANTCLNIETAGDGC